MVPHGNSSTLFIFILTDVTLKGTRQRHNFMTLRLPSRPTTSILNAIPKVWTPEEGLIHNPPPASRPPLPRRPNIRRKDVSANSMLSPTVVPRVVLVTLSITISQRLRLLQLDGLLLPAINDDSQNGGCGYSSDELNDVWSHYAYSPFRWP
jgi:hypothetical protein